MKKHLILSASLLAILFLLLFCAASGAALAEDGKPTISAAEWQAKGYTVVYLEDRFGADETGGKLADGYFVLRKDINYLTEKPGSGNAVNGNSFTRSGFQTVQTGKDSNANMYCIQSGDRFYFGHVDTEANGDTIVLKDMVSINNSQYSPNVTPYTVGAWIDWRAEFRAEIPGVPFFGDGYFQIFLDHYSYDPGALSPTEHTIEYYNSIHFDEIGVKSEDVITEEYDVGLYSIEQFVSALRLRLSLKHYWGELAFDADALMGVEVLFKSYGPAFWGWSAIPHPKNGFTVNKVSKANSYGDITLALNLGPKISAEWLLIEDMELDVDVFGVLMIGEYSGHDFEPPVTKTTYHLCTNCADESLQGTMGPLKFIIDLLGSDPETLIDTGPVYLGEFYHFYYSEEYEESGEGTCPHRAYHTQVHVTDSTNSSSLSNVEVSFHPDSMDCSPYNKGTTGSDGKVDLYMKPGEDYYVIAEMESPLDPDWVISKERMMHKGEEADTVEIALDIPVKTVYFKNTGSGEPADWPDDISFSPFLSRQVILPDTVPEMSGRQFAGWNTKEDGTGTSYAPGTKLSLEDDLTLWAQWKTAGTVWYVVYNARGGTKAPGPQEIPLGKDAVLTEELPESSTLIFKGWTPDLHKMDPVYQPGDTLKYDSRKNYVVLYALWDLSPVPEPIHISFVANSLEEVVMPEEVWLGEASWVHLKPAEPALGSIWAFVGWSEDPQAKAPEYQAGRSYYFSRNTVLYAIWEKQNTVTLTFRDSLSDPASGIPNPITILPSMSRDVRIPDEIPEKSGRSFISWNTAQDGSGKEYTPGSVITLTEDTTLWAQWNISGNSWYVVYNANGGTKAPVAQEFPKGQDAVLTRELPESGTLVFKGWTPNLQAMDPVYQPGDTLRYDPQKNQVKLYAMWELSPVPEPIHISFKPNSLEEAVMPADVWLEKASWLNLEPAQPALGSVWAFVGWSEDPQAKAPEYRAGSSYYFSRDTVLYAIWGKQDTVTLTFRDPLSDPAAGMPDPITILPSMSRDVRIPDEIPEKSGRSFTGWNTAKDGSGKEYTPGSVITLTEDTTLWAQWNISGNSWYVVYNANGGTKEPVAQEFPKGRDAVLTKDLPENGALVFRGWTPDLQKMDPVYQPGDTLRYDSRKNLVMLYALWEQPPVERPVIVTFDANGGRLDTVPHSVSAPKMVWFRLPEEEPVWDGQHAFLGWSRNPEAAKAEIKPGSMAIFGKDTKLFAVWKARYTVTEGAGSVWTKGSQKTQRFVADGNISYFTEFRIDGKRFTDGVEISSGSTVADIKAWAMETLSTGTHKVTFVYEDGEASAVFTVRSKVPPTGDTGHPALWLFLVLLGMAGLAATGRLASAAKEKK